MPFATTPLSADPIRAAARLPSISRRVQGILSGKIMAGEIILGTETVTSLTIEVDQWGEERFLDLDAEWYPGTVLPTGNFTKTFETFKLGYWAFAMTQTDAFFREEGANNPNPLARENTTRYAGLSASYVMRSREKERIDLLTTVANYGVNTTDLASGAEWDTGTGDPLDDIRTAVQAIRDGVGADERMMRVFIPYDVWKEAHNFADFQAFRTSGGNVQSSGVGSIAEFSSYVNVDCFTDDAGMDYTLALGGTKTRPWGKNVIVYVRPDIANEEWGAPRFGTNFDYSLTGAITPFLDIKGGLVWHYPWIENGRAFIQQPLAGFLFRNAVT